MEVEALIRIVIGLAIKIHNHIGPGCFEKVYEEILYYELSKLDIEVKRQVFFPIKYEGLLIRNAYKLDLLIEDKLVVELKSVEPLPPVYFQQIKSQLSLLQIRNGMILNFKTALMKDGIYRIYNNKAPNI